MKSVLVTVLINLFRDELILGFAISEKSVENLKLTWMRQFYVGRCLSGKITN